MNIVKVVWVDATFRYEEHDNTNLPQPSTVCTYGEQVQINELGIWVAAEVLDEATYRGTTFIPKELIREVQVLERAFDRATSGSKNG